MSEPWPDPDPPSETCRGTELPIYTNRREIGWRLRRSVPDLPYKDVSIRPCPSCAGLHVTLKEPKAPVAETPAPNRRRCKKRRYRSEQDALLTMKIITAPDNPARQEQRAYQCPQCAGAWHLSSRK